MKTRNFTKLNYRNATLASLLLALAGATPAVAQQYVDGAGNCGGNTPCNLTIQAAVTAATAGSSVIVYPGTYNEEVTINKALTLQSSGGATVTTIQYPFRGNYEAPVIIPGPGSNITIGGGVDKGFTIIGMDNTNDAAGAGSEAAAILIGGSYQSMSNINISYNTLTANGEAAILTYNNGSVDYINGLFISNNTFNGKTYEGSTPASGALFSNYNTAKPAITTNPGVQNLTIAKNTISTQTGTGNTGNHLMLITANGSTITQNIINGTIGGVNRGQLTLSGTAATVQCNVFDINSSTGFFINQLRASGTSPYVVATVSNANTFLPSPSYYTGNNFSTSFSVNQANSVFPAPGCTNALPVEFIKLSASLRNNNVLNSTWEINEAEAGCHYEIQTSCNTADFQTIDQVDANKSVRYTRQSEATDDCSPLLVRIRQVKADGKLLYSNIVSVSPKYDGAGISVYPNPAKQFVTIGNSPDQATATLLDYTGRKVITQQISRTQNKIDVSMLGSGIYFIKVTAGDLVLYSGKLVK
jgi:hypothetical protein